MEPITATLTAAKEINETAKTIQKVYNVSKEMKTVAESEGKDQIIATKNLTGSAGLEHESKIEKSETKHKELKSDDDLSNNDCRDFKDSNSLFVDRLEPSSDAPDLPESNPEMKQEGLTEQEKLEIKDETGWSDHIVDAIRSKEEANIYIDAGLVEEEIDGKTALIQPNIDGRDFNEPKWPDWNNKDLAEDGYPPRDKNGHPYELHHIGQNPDSPLAELTYEQHHCDGNFKILHTFDESAIDRIQFNKERKEYWHERSNSL